ncbi:MAG: ABC transporter ATP-binding protein [Nitrospiraceae bacterium]|nr:ABC transporter ATP-binding protein [Nitrospiraceae bacterium]
MISLNNVSKAFGGLTAVRDLSLSIAPGEIFGLVGPNGAGKTTTLRMMTGLLIPDTGQIRFGEYDIVREPLRAKASFGYVPDRPFLYEKLTARELLSFVASLYGVGRGPAIEASGRLLHLFGISDVGDELIEGFSQGMRQRLLFASALVHDPRALLIDEPFIGLDPFGIRTLKEIIRDLSSKGMSIFLATHSLHIAEEICHRVGFINKGVLVTIKAREELREIEGGLEGFFLRMG